MQIHSQLEKLETNIREIWITIHKLEIIAKFQPFCMVISPTVFAVGCMTWDLAGKLGPVSISDKMSYFKISQSLEATRFVLRVVQSLCNLTVNSAAVLLMCLSNVKAMWRWKLLISRLRDFTKFMIRHLIRYLNGTLAPELERPILSPRSTT